MTTFFKYLKRCHTGGENLISLVLAQNDGVEEEFNLGFIHSQSEYIGKSESEIKNIGNYYFKSII